MKVMNMNEFKKRIKSRKSDELDFKITIEEFSKGELVETEIYDTSGFFLNAKHDEESSLSICKIKSEFEAFMLTSSFFCSIIKCCMSNGLSTEETMEFITIALSCAFKDFGINMSTQTIDLRDKDNLN